MFVSVCQHKVSLFQYFFLAITFVHSLRHFITFISRIGWMSKLVGFMFLCVCSFVMPPRNVILKAVKKIYFLIVSTLCAWGIIICL